MRYLDQPWFLLDENSGPPSGGSGAAGPSGEGASAPAPPSSPSEGGATPPEGAEAAPSPAHDPFDGMESNDYFDSVDLGPEAAGTDDESGLAQPPAPEAGAVSEPPPATAQPAQVAPQAASQTAPAAQAENVLTSGRSQLDLALDGFKGAANQTALADWAARELFKLSDEDVAAYEAEPGRLIPQLMGRVYTHAMQSAVNLIKNIVPEIVNSGITTQQTNARRASEALNEFYQANPHLSADQHGAAVDRWAKSFRATNPQASRADAIAFVGKAVSAEFGIWPSQNGTGQAAPRRAAPFAPARQGGRAPTPARGPSDPYAGMEDDYD